ncbi:hypothetical protein FP2506_18724 [Fulvimarina pelagi HTCC2506]|uniref:DUF3307 domain-containing protein n=1 Tax=Fulvimarina pelagi HTCC2506 TaxID=314231 RepID=Q0G0N8_9HYPH|nr:DUF3307 domain-containing protein [Fulvimarina pelagi]EAU40951.1 hypothetical protein FP2506_18724 [Fulvimarina pelagi HTCC2506]
MIEPLDLAFVFVAFVIKHVLADFVFQTEGMALGKTRRSGWLTPLAAHAGVHAVLTLIVVMIVAPSLWWLAAVDFLVHATIDQTKTVVARRYKPDEQRFWTAFGIDQAAHQITHFVYVLFIVTG